MPARTFYLIRQIQLAGYREVEASLRDYSVSPAQYMILSIVNGRGAGLSSAELSRRLGVSPQATNELVVALHTRGLIDRQEATGNRRVLRISLTSPGRKLLAKCDAAVDRIETRFLCGLTRSERLTLRKLLGVVMADLVSSRSGPRHSRGLVNEAWARKGTTAVDDALVRR